LKAYNESLNELKSKASNAQGQQEAIQAGNEIATKQIELLAMIHALLIEQNQMFSAMTRTEVDEQAQARTAEAIFFGHSSVSKKWYSAPHKTFQLGR
jgi:P-type conjugative transfer protein TrbJ